MIVILNRVRVFLIGYFYGGELTILALMKFNRSSDTKNRVVLLLRSLICLIFKLTVKTQAYSRFS